MMLRHNFFQKILITVIKQTLQVQYTVCNNKNIMSSKVYDDLK